MSCILGLLIILLTITLLGSIIAMLIGLAYPQFIIFLGNKEKRTRKNVIIYCTLPILISLISMCIITGIVNTFSAKEDFNEGVKLYNQGKYQEAINKLDQALNNDSNNQKIIDKKEEVVNAFVEELKQEGLKLYEQSKYEEAISKFNKALTLKPDDQDIIKKKREAENKLEILAIQKGSALYKQGKYEEALNTFNQILALNPENQEVINKKEKTEKAIELEEREAKAKELEDLLAKSQELTEKKQYEEAIDCLDRVLETIPSHVNAWINKGYCLAEIKKYEEAIKCFDRALELEPDNSLALRNKDYSSKKLTEEKLTSLKWNEADTDAFKNGNMLLALPIILKLNSEALKSMSEYVDIAQVNKAPWKYYGKMLIISGKVSNIQDYPPGGEISSTIAGGEACSEMNIFTNEGVAVKFFLIGESGYLKEDNYIVAYGLPVGFAEGTNAFGGAVSNLLVIGKM